MCAISNFFKMLMEMLSLGGTIFRQLERNLQLYISTKLGVLESNVKYIIEMYT